MRIATARRVIVRFVSSLNQEEETLFACALLKAACRLLDLMPIAYSIRIETSANSVYEHSKPAEDSLRLPADLSPDVRNLPRA